MSKKSKLMVWLVLVAALVLVPMIVLAQEGVSPAAAAGGAGELVMEDGAADSGGVAPGGDAGG